MSVLHLVLMSVVLFCASGEGRIDCPFESTPIGHPVTLYVFLEYDAELEAEWLPPFTSIIAGRPDTRRLSDGTIDGYYISSAYGGRESLPGKHPLSDPRLGYLASTLCF